VYITIVIFFGLIEWGVLFPPPERELVGTTTVVSRVPIYVLYDPPGSLSYSTCFSNFTPVVLKLDAMSGDVQVHGEYSTFIDATSFSTPTDSRLHVIYALELNQTWQLWRYSEGTNVWFQAYLTHCSYRGSDWLHFDMAQYINSRGMWIENKTGESSPFALQLDLASNTTETVTFECTQKDFTPFGAGYLVDIIGHDVRIGVSISIKRPFNTTYVFNNNMISLDVQMMCNGPMTQVSPTFYKTEGALMWFSE
jgi:hypothetical protein